MAVPSGLNFRKKSSLNRNVLMMVSAALTDFGPVVKIVVVVAARSRGKREGCSFMVLFLVNVLLAADCRCESVFE